MTITSSGLGSKAIKTFDLLDQIVTMLNPSSNNVFFWPFLESTGQVVQSYGLGVDEALDVTAAGSSQALDVVAGVAPLQHAGGIHSYHFESGDSPALVGTDTSTLSFNGTVDTAMSIGCFFYLRFGGTLISKYDVAGTLREYKLDVNTSDLRFLAYDESADAEEGVRTTTALALGQWYSGIVTYGGAGGNGSGQAADDMLIYINGALVADTDIDDASYVDMEDTSAPLMIGATDDKAAPASEFDGRMALPFIVNTELTVANVATFNGIGKILLGL